MQELNNKATNNTLRPSKVRWIGLGLVFFITFISNIDRANIAVCTSTIIDDLSITPLQIGMITSAFSVSYALLQIPGSVWIRRYGTRCVVAAAIAFWSLFTLTTGASAGFMSLMISRVLFGFGEAPLYPAMNQYTLHWFPVRERAFANAMPNAGSFLALVVAPPLMVFLLDLLGWRWVFYSCAILGFVAAALWYRYTRDLPKEHPLVNAAELQWIKSGHSAAVSGKSVPWRKMFKFRSFWCIGCTYFCSVYMLQYFVYWLPFYLQTQLHMDLKTMGFAASLPWICIFSATMLVGKLSDALVRRGHSLFIARNALILIGFGASALLMYIGTLLTDPWAVVVMLSAALGFIGFNMTIPWAIASDIGGEYTGVISSWMNTWGQVGAAIMATMSAYIGTYFGWNYTLIALIFIAILGIASTVMIKPEQKLTE